MKFNGVEIPEGGQKITLRKELVVPNNPIIPFFEGDGVGRDIWKASQFVFDAAVEKVSKGARKVVWYEVFAGEKSLQQFGTLFPYDTLGAIQEFRISLKGPLIGMSLFHALGLATLMRPLRDLCPCVVRPVRDLPGIRSRFGDVDLVIVRENTEGLYPRVEWEVVPGVIESFQVTTEKATTRIAVFAFEFAKKFNRKKVTLVHKANIMKKSDGLFLKCFRQVKLRRPIQ